MAEPIKNTYVLTVVLSGVRKRHALEIAGSIEDIAEDYIADRDLDDVMVISSHVKDLVI